MSFQSPAADQSHCRLSICTVHVVVFSVGVQQSLPLVLEVAVVPGRAGKSSLCIWKPGAFSGGLGS